MSTFIGVILFIGLYELEEPSSYLPLYLTLISYGSPKFRMPLWL